MALLDSGFQISDLTLPQIALRRRLRPSGASKSRRGSNTTGDGERVDVHVDVAQDVVGRPLRYLVAVDVANVTIVSAIKDASVRRAHHWVYPVGEGIRIVASDVRHVAREH